MRVVQAIRNLNPALHFAVYEKIKNEEDYNEIKWIIGKDDTDTAIFGTPDSIPGWAEIQAELLMMEAEEVRLKPFTEWKKKMEKSDGSMSRHRENFITRIENGIADNDEEQKRYNAKVAFRKQKPYEN